MTEVQKVFPKIRVFRRNVGLFKSPHGNRMIKIEHKGMADLYALYPLQGGVLAHIEIEVKTEFGQPTKHQQNWEDFIKRNMGLYLLVRPSNFEECFKKIKEYVVFP